MVVDKNNVTKFVAPKMRKQGKHGASDPLEECSGLRQFETPGAAIRLLAGPAFHALGESAGTPISQGIRCLRRVQMTIHGLPIRDFRQQLPFSTQALKWVIRQLPSAKWRI
jgi:hypothetical protein